MKGEWHFQRRTHQSTIFSLVQLRYYCMYLRVFCGLLFKFLYSCISLISNGFLMGCCHAALVTVPALRVVSWDREVTQTLLYLWQDVPPRKSLQLHIRVKLTINKWHNHQGRQQPLQYILHFMPLGLFLMRNLLACFAAQCDVLWSKKERGCRLPNIIIERQKFSQRSTQWIVESVKADCKILFSSVKQKLVRRQRAGWEKSTGATGAR